MYPGKHFFCSCSCSIFCYTPTLVSCKVKTCLLLLLYPQSCRLKGLAQRHLIGSFFYLFLTKVRVTHWLPTRWFSPANLNIWTKWPPHCMLAFTIAVNSASHCNSWVIDTGIRYELGVITGQSKVSLGDIWLWDMLSYILHHKKCVYFSTGDKVDFSYKSDEAMTLCFLVESGQQNMCLHDSIQTQLCYQVWFWGIITVQNIQS